MKKKQEKKDTRKSVQVYFETHDLLIALYGLTKRRFPDLMKEAIFNLYQKKLKEKAAIDLLKEGEYSQE
jgi:hypothetical protein